MHMKMIGENNSTIYNLLRCMFYSVENEIFLNYSKLYTNSSLFVFGDKTATVTDCTMVGIWKL